MPDDQIVALLQQRQQGLAGIADVPDLFLKRAFLTAFEQGIAAKSHYCEFFHIAQK